MKTLKMFSPRNATLALTTLMSLGGAAVLTQPASAEPLRVTIVAPVAVGPVCAAPVFDARVIVGDRRDIRFDDWRVGGDRRDVPVQRFGRFDDVRPGFDRRDR